MIKDVTVDLFEAPIDILVHGCNAMRVMGGGLALEVKNRFPEAYRVDFNTKLGDEKKLGTYSTAKVHNPAHPSIKFIVNLYTQLDFGRSRRHTSYDAVDNGLRLLRRSLETNESDDLVIGVPHGLGAALGGGSWPVIRTIIEEALRDYKSDVLICEKV